MRAPIRALRPTLALALAICAGTTAAATPPLATADGQRYSVGYNSHGAVLQGARGTIYLGRDCDAWSRSDGRGDWHWANGGLVIELARQRLAFPRQELAVAGAEACRR